MNHSGDAAEQIVRMSLEGTEVALKLTGSAAKHIAAAIYSVMKNRDKNKLKGTQRLTSMLKSGKELKVFTINEKDLKQFATEAKRYGVVYCALRGKGATADGLVDVMVRAEDASKINRIVERFKLSTVDSASIKHEIEKYKADRSVAQQNILEQNTEDKLIDDLLSAPVKQEERPDSNPSVARTEKSPRSEPISKKPRKAVEGTDQKAEERPSVRKALRDITAKRQKAPDSPKTLESQRSPQTAILKTVEHKQPRRKKKSKVR